MPYNGPNDTNLPTHIKKLSEKKRKQWVAVFNSMMSSENDEGKAFAGANSAVSSKKHKGYIEYVWDVEGRQVSGDTVDYQPVGGTNEKCCAVCNWFISPDTCVLVHGDIAAGGVCSLYMAEPEYEATPMPVTIVKEADPTSNIITKVIEGIKNFLKPDNAAGDAPPPAVQADVIMPGLDHLITTNSPPQNLCTFTKQADGRTRFFVTFTNNFKDKHGEIITDAAHKEYVDWADKAGYYPLFQIWHCGEKAALGPCDWLEYTDGFVCCSGVIDADKEAIAERIAQELNLAASHGFVGIETKKGVIERYRTFEVSVLPVWGAANEGTATNFMKETPQMPFSDKKKNWLKDVAGMTDEQIAGFETSVKEMGEKLKSAGVEFKEGEGDTITSNVVALQEAVTKLTEIVVSQKQAIDALNTDMDTRVANIFTAEIAKLPQGFKASESEDNKVGKKEDADAASWFGAVINSVK